MLTSAFDLLYEAGVGGFTVDEVARRSGVAKTTIYRHWLNREALVLDACSKITPDQAVPDTGTLALDLRTILTDVANLLRTANWAAIMPSIVDAAERESSFAEVHAQIQYRHAAPLRIVLERGKASGTLPLDVEVSTLVATLLGALFYRRWYSREPVDDAFIDRVIGVAIPPR